MLFRSGDASFVIIASVSAAETDNASSYGPIKAALIHYAKGVAREGAPKGVRCNVVSPGTVFFEGGVWDRWSRPARRGSCPAPARHLLLRRLMRPVRLMLRSHYLPCSLHLCATACGPRLCRRVDPAQ